MKSVLLYFAVGVFVTVAGQSLIVDQIVNEDNNIGAIDSGIFPATVTDTLQQVDYVPPEGTTNNGQPQIIIYSSNSQVGQPQSPPVYPYPIPYDAGLGPVVEQSTTAQQNQIVYVDSSDSVSNERFYYG